MKKVGHENESHPEGRRIAAVAATSGGLDSLLAAEVIRRAGIDVTLVHVRHLFSAGEAGREQLRRTAERHGFPLRIEDASEAHLETIRHPQHGYGRGMNPCVDCRIFMLRIAKRVMEDVGAKFVVTGEVLGQRPKSQNLKALAAAAEESGLGDRLVRPLSANLLPETLPVREGWLRKEDLYAIQGRSREPQMALAAEFGIEDYPQPAGGCMLIERTYAERVRDAFRHLGRDQVDLAAFKLLQIGRHFRISESAKAIVGRNRFENEALEAYAEGRVRLEPAEVMGPTTLIEGSVGAEELILAASLTARYCDADRPVIFRVVGLKGVSSIEAQPLDKDDPRIPDWRIGD